jgi:hypothetical protein
MATYTATPALANRPANASGWARQKQTATGALTVSTILASGDTLKMCKLPRGAIVTGGRLRGGRLASGATQASQSMILNFGVDASITTFTGTNVSILSTSSALGLGLIPNAAAVAEVKDSGYNWALGGLLISDGPFQLQDDATVYITVTASAGGGSFTTGTIYLDIEYYMGVHA